MHQNVLVLALKKVWDSRDSNLFIKDAYRFTAEGMKTYWKAVDRTLQFCDSTIMKRVEKVAFKANLPFKRENRRDQKDKYRWTASSLD